MLAQKFFKIPKGEIDWKHFISEVERIKKGTKPLTDIYDFLDKDSLYKKHDFNSIIGNIDSALFKRESERDLTNIFKQLTNLKEMITNLKSEIDQLPQSQYGEDEDGFCIQVIDLIPAKRLGQVIDIIDQLLLLQNNLSVQPNPIQ